jgi:hypothetical protein
VGEVDGMNVYWAAMEVRRRAVEAVTGVPDYVLLHVSAKSRAVLPRANGGRRG